MRSIGAEGEEMSEFDPTPELQDDTPIDNVRLSTRIRNALNYAALKTVGEACGPRSLTEKGIKKSLSVESG